MNFAEIFLVLRNVYAKPKIQDGGSKPGNTYKSVYIRDIAANFQGI